MYSGTKNHDGIWKRCDQAMPINRNLKGLLYLSLLAIAAYLLFSMENSSSISKDRNPFMKEEYSRQRGMKTKCPRKVVEFSDNPMAKTALASYLGTGNTWLRDLLQQVTGIATGSVYCDAELQDFFIGECVTDDSTIVVKTNEWFDKHMYKKAVLLIRSPFMSFGSHFNFELTRDPNGLASKSTYDKHFKNFLKIMLPNWRWFNEEWMNDFKGPKYVMFYDKLKSDLPGEMRKLLKFLDVKYNETDFQCMIKNYNDLAHRKSTQKENILEYFSTEQFSKTQEDISLIEKMASKITGENHKIERYI